MLRLLRRLSQISKNAMLVFGITAYYMLSNLLDILVESIFSKYNTIETLPIVRFQKVIETKDYKYLFKRRVRKSKTNYRRLEKTWFRIIQEYENETKTGYTSLLFRKVKNIKALEHNIKLLKIAYNLKLAGSKDIETVLKELGCNKKTDNEVRSFIINTETKLAVMLAEYDNLTRHSEQKVNFLDQVAKVEQSLGYHLELEKITVKRWCAIVNNLNNNLSHGRENTDNRGQRIQTTRKA